MLFSDEKITLETSDVDGNEEFDEEVLHMRQLLKTKLVDMDLSVRALNCLKAADVETLGDLVPVSYTHLKQRHAFHGLYRSLVNNMVIGVSEGYKKELELVGVGSVSYTHLY